ncbi:hypothetical protein ACLK2F_09355 [Escherichia coli]
MDFDGAQAHSALLTPNALLCCFVKSSTAGNVWEAGRYPPPKRCNRVDA